MKKKIIIILSTWLILSVLFAVWYKNSGAKSYNVNIPSINSGAKAAKEPFKTIGTAAAETVLKQRKPNFIPFAKQMKKFGAENVKLKIERNNKQFSKTLPVVIIGGKKYKNKTVCAIISYDYNGVKYEVGTCK